jgi:hypothetical protein
LTYEGSVFANPIEEALALYIQTGNQAYLEAIPDDVSPLAMSRALENVLVKLGIQEPRSEFDPAVVFGAGYVLMGVVAASGKSQAVVPPDATNYIKQLEQGVEGAHAWSKHGPTLEANAQLQAAAARSSAAQTRFLTEEEMTSSIQATLTTNMADIQARAASASQQYRYPYKGPEVNLVGYLQQGGKVVPITGRGPVNVVISFNGQGGWGLFTAYPLYR